MAQGKFHVQSPEILLFLAERSCPAGAFVTRMAKPECCHRGGRLRWCVVSRRVAGRVCRAALDGMCSMGW
ncbi:Unknown protein sequence [Pseudomonas syringae pv. syringae]|nr:Unknown protein sequence [Pseudomonas syringae pv. syringae]